MIRRPTRSEKGAGNDREADRGPGCGVPPSALIVMDLEGRVIQFGDDATELLGYTEDEAAGARLGDLIIPEPMRRAHETRLARLRNTGDNTRGGPASNDTREIPALRKDGSQLRVRLTVSPLRFEGRELLIGAVSAAASTPVVSPEASSSAACYRAEADEEAAREAAEEPERGESARLVTLLNSLTAGVLAEDDEHRVLAANPALVEMFSLGVHPSALTGARVPDEPPVGVDPVGWATLNRVTEGEQGRHELTLPQRRVVEVVCTAITVDGGSLGRMWVLYDVTASVAARHALEEHNQRLAELSALKSEFIAIVSHELRTPLSSISSFTEMLAGPGELTSPDAPHAIAAIARNTDRMLVLVQDLRLLSQLETGDQAVASGAVDLADLTREVGDSIETGGRLITIRHEVTDGPLLDGDEQLLRQLVHTVAGTVAACAAGDEMTLRATADQGGWTLSATAPSGEFITDEQLLATPLPVLDDASRQRSAALSVLIARAIAQSHGGALITQVWPGATATITVRLPLGGPRGLSSAPE